MLDEEDLKTIETIARNGQSGRITPWEIARLVASYRTLREIMDHYGPGTLASDDMYERAVVALVGPRTASTTGG